MIDNPALDSLMNIDQSAYVEKVTIDSGRLSALKEAACSLGARGGLSRRSEEIRFRIEKNATDLDNTYQFQSVMLEFGVLPPVVVEARDSVDQKNDYSISYSGVVYKMINDARFVTVSPTWRSYLFKGLEKGGVDLPNAAFLPKNAEEKEVWKQEVKRCWDLGVSQANDIFEYNKQELKRDFAGMLRYKLLALKGEIKAPVVVTRNTPESRINTEKKKDVRVYVIKDGASF